MPLVCGPTGRPAVRSLGALLLAVWLAAACQAPDVRRVAAGAGQDGPTTSTGPTGGGQPTKPPGPRDEAVSIEVDLLASLECQPGDGPLVMEGMRRELTEEEPRSPDPRWMTPESAMRTYLDQPSWPQAKNLAFERWKPQGWRVRDTQVVMRYRRGSATRGVAVLERLPNGQWSPDFFATCWLSLSTEESR